jgi:putative transcriptional regulator
LRTYAVKKSRLLNEMHETARGLERMLVLNKHTMREFDVLTLPPVKELTAKQIRTLRTRNRFVRRCSQPC